MTSSALTSTRFWIRQSGRVALGAVSSVFFTTLLLSLRQVDDVPVFITVLLIVLAGLSAWRPHVALVVLAGVVPLAAWTGRTWNGAVAWPETLVVAFAAGYSARAMWTRGHRLDRLHLPIVIFTAIVAASLAVRLLVLYVTIGGEALNLHLWQTTTVDYFIGNGGFRDLDAAMRLIEGMVLLRAAASVSQMRAAFAPRLTRWFVVGAAVAALLNLWRVWQGALRLDSPVAGFLEYLTTLRYNVHYGDVNAAGSYFVMALLAAIGLTMASKRGRWIPAVVLIASSVVLSGSRTAFLAGGLAAIVWGVQWFRDPRQSRPSRWPVLAVSSVVLIASAAGVLYLSSRKNVAPFTALEIRAEFARTTFRMVESHPAFGVGVGLYQDRSSRYSSPVLIQTFRLSNENAHNNFLQVLGELGLAGFAAFIGVLGYAGVRCSRLMDGGAGPLQRGVVLGLVAFVLTWLAGHPLLIDEPALLFWLVLGTAAGWGQAGGTQSSAGQRGGGVVTLLVCGAVALTIPVRATRELADANLEHRGIGLSLWQDGEDGVRYRLAGAQSTLFIPGDARVVTIPLRSVQPEIELEVGLRLDGRLADVVRVSGDRWFKLQFLLPSDPNAPRFFRLDLRVFGVSSGDTALLMVGKVEPM